MIEKLNDLYISLDCLFQGINNTCQECQYDKCSGYVWLLEEESEMLYEKGIEIVQINNDLFFFNSFDTKDGGLDIEQFKPRCPFWKKEACSIYEIRPLSCRMYPLNFALEDGMLKLVLHMDCLFSERKFQETSLIKDSLSIFNQIDRNLLKSILSTYLKVIKISKFPKGDNNYTVIDVFKGDRNYV